MRKSRKGSTRSRKRNREKKRKKTAREVKKKREEAFHMAVKDEKE